MSIASVVHATQDVAMQRRSWLQLAGTAALAACVPRGRPTPTDIRAVAFDLFTLFDPRDVQRRVEALLGHGADAIAATWSSRLFEYSWLRAASGRFAPFDQLVVDALAFASEMHGQKLDEATSTALCSVFTELTPWPDARESLETLRARGLRLATLANFSPRMIAQLVTRGRLDDLFDARISTDEAQTFKPAPQAYALAEKHFKMPRSQIAYAAFGGWDAAGATWFGMPTFWVNRFGSAVEHLVSPTAAGPDLGHLVAWVDN